MTEHIETYQNNLKHPLNIPLIRSSKDGRLSLFFYHNDTIQCDIFCQIELQQYRITFKVSPGMMSVSWHFPAGHVMVAFHTRRCANGHKELLAHLTFAAQRGVGRS